MIREFDISPEYCCGAMKAPPLPDDVACMLRNGYRRGWVGASYSSEARVQSYLAAFEAGGLASGVYGFIHFDATAKLHLDNAIRHVVADRRRDFLYDIELGDPYSYNDPAFVLGRIEWGIDYVRSYDIEPICYTSPWFWNPATNGSQETFGTRAIIAEYIHDPDNPPPVENVEACGGWSLQSGNVYGWQYAGTIETCNMNTDRILVIKEADVAFDALKRATQDQALRFLAGDALNDNMTSLVNRLAYFGVIPPGTTALKEKLVTEP